MLILDDSQYKKYPDSKKTIQPRTWAPPIAPRCSNPFFSPRTKGKYNKNEAKLYYQVINNPNFLKLPCRNQHSANDREKKCRRRAQITYLQGFEKSLNSQKDPPASIPTVSRLPKDPTWSTALHWFRDHWYQIRPRWASIARSKSPDTDSSALQKSWSDFSTGITGGAGEN